MPQVETEALTRVYSSVILSPRAVALPISALRHTMHPFLKALRARIL